MESYRVRIGSAVTKAGESYRAGDVVHVDPEMPEDSSWLDQHRSALDPVTMPGEYLNRSMREPRRRSNR